MRNLYRTKGMTAVKQYEISVITLYDINVLFNLEMFIWLSVVLIHVSYVERTKVGRPRTKPQKKILYDSVSNIDILENK